MRGEPSDDQRPKAADAAPHIEENVLCRGAAARGIALRDQRPVSADHSAQEDAGQRARKQQDRGVFDLRIDERHRHGADLERDKEWLAADPVGELPEHPHAHCATQHDHRGPQRRLRQREAQLGRQVRGQPDDGPVVAEVLDGRHDADADRRPRGLGTCEQIVIGVGVAFLLGGGNEHRRLVQEATQAECDQCRHQPYEEHAAPTDHGQKQRRHERRNQYAGLPTERHVGRRACPLFRGPGFGNKRHADAELAAETNSRNRPVGQEIPIGLRRRAQPGENRKQQDRPGQHPDAAEPVAQGTYDEAADHRADERQGHQRASLRWRQVQARNYSRKHERQDQEIEAVHRVSDIGRDQRLACVAVDRYRGRGLVGPDVLDRRIERHACFSLAGFGRRCGKLDCRRRSRSSALAQALSCNKRSLLRQRSPVRKRSPAKSAQAPRLSIQSV